MSNPEMDLTRATPAQLFAWYGNRPAEYLGNALSALRDEIVRQARAQWEQERGTALTEEQIAGAWDEVRPTASISESWAELSTGRKVFERRFVNAILARGQSPAPDVRALQREAAAKALAWAEAFVLYPRDADGIRKYREATYPDPAPERRSGVDRRTNADGGRRS